MTQSTAKKYKLPVFYVAVGHTFKFDYNGKGYVEIEMRLRGGWFKIGRYHISSEEGSPVVKFVDVERKTVHEIDTEKDALKTDKLNDWNDALRRTAYILKQKEKAI